MALAQFAAGGMLQTLLVAERHPPSDGEKVGKKQLVSTAKPREAGATFPFLFFLAELPFHHTFCLKAQKAHSEIFSFGPF